MVRNSYFPKPVRENAFKGLKCIICRYKDDQLLHEDERHTFYADEDGFFALTIDPVQVEDTGRYTCMATNEYGQASTSAFFRVLKGKADAFSLFADNIQMNGKGQTGEASIKNTMA